MWLLSWTYTCVLYVRKPHLIKTITETLLSFTISMTRSPSINRNFWQLSPWQRTHNIWNTFHAYIYITNTSTSRFTSLNLLQNSIFPYQNNIPNSEFRGYITDNFLLSFTCVSTLLLHTLFISQRYSKFKVPCQTLRNVPIRGVRPNINKRKSRDRLSLYTRWSTDHLRWSVLSLPLVHAYKFPITRSVYPLHARILKINKLRGTVCLELNRGCFLMSPPHKTAENKGKSERKQQNWDPRTPN